MSKKTVLLYFGDVFWCTTPYEGVEIYRELNKEFNVIPLINHKDIRINKKWRGNEKFYFDSSVFESLPFVKLKNQNEILEIYKKSRASLMIMPSHMQFKPWAAQRNRYLKSQGVTLCFWDTGGGDGLYCDSKTTGWEYFFAKGDAWKEVMKDSSKFPNFCGVKMKENPDKIFVTGSPSFDHLRGTGDKLNFCKKYNLDKDKPIIAYLPGNPRPDGKYRDTMNQIHQGLFELMSLNYQICFKTHPADYISTESMNEYYGVHPRAHLGGYSALSIAMCITTPHTKGVGYRA